MNGETALRPQQRFSLISVRLGEGRLAKLNGSGFGRTDSAKQLEAGTMTAILEARTAQDSDTPATPVFAAPIRHPSAWRVADFRSPADYSIDLDALQHGRLRRSRPLRPQRQIAVDRPGTISRKGAAEPSILH